MAEKKRGLAARLKWLLHFANLDISALSHEDFIKELDDFLSLIVVIREPFSKARKKVGGRADNEMGRDALIKAQGMVREICSALIDPPDFDRPSRPPSLAEGERGYDYGWIRGGPAGIRGVLFPKFFVSYTFNREGPKVRVIRAGCVTGTTKRSLKRWNTVCFPPVSGESSLVIGDMWSAIGAFLMPIVQGIEFSRVLKCPECRRFEFTNKKKQKNLCRRCLTKARVEKFRERERAEIGKSRY